MRVAVAVPVPLLDELTYLVPPEAPVPPIGARVLVPIGRREVLGVVVAQDAPAPAGTLRPLLRVLDEEAFLPPPVLSLCRFAADYYMAGLGDVLRAALPPGAEKGAAAFRTARVAQLTTAGEEVVAERVGTPSITPKQRQALRVLQSTGPTSVSRLQRDGTSADVLSRLAAKGLVAITEAVSEREPAARTPPPRAGGPEGRRLSSEQREAYEVLRPMVVANAFGVALVHGVTGSGKTELYLRLVQEAVGSGRQALVLVPEIALTSTMTAVFRATFGSRVAIQHSGISAGERHDQWHRIRRGDVDVVVGTRSAVFAPMTRLGLVVVDEEHDGSYKQEETPRYHGRDLAIVRAREARALVVLGSATPSLESYQHASQGKYRLVTLRTRVGDRSLPAVRVVDMRNEFASRGPEVVLSDALEAALALRLERREQAVVLLNRRGYATSVFCRQCGDSFDCPNCNVSLTVHTARGTHAGGAAFGLGKAWGRCHYCNYSVRIPPQCRKCAAPYLELAGFGTARVEAAILARFPDARVARIDRDTIGRKGALDAMLDRFGRGELDILVGTQMIAKGHDFPNVTLVGVISADVGLGLADFRASERTFQLLTQVSGRAGRGAEPGEAIVQTVFPEHYSVTFGCAQDYRGFFAKEVEFREAMQYPPFVAMTNVIVKGRSLEEALSGAGELAQALRGEATKNMLVLGPAPAPMSRLRGEHRAQVFLKGTRRVEMRQALRAALARLPSVRRRTLVDVDPLNVL